MHLLYTDPHLVLCQKPVGMDSEHGLLTLLKEQLPGAFYPVHRLDTATGGVIAVARTKQAAAALSAAVTRGELRKEYRAVVRGIPPEGEWCDLLFRDARQNKSYVVARPRRGVKEARLTCRVLGTVSESDAPLSLLALALDTGRTHQIRVQSAARGCPLLGDGKYGSRDRRTTVALWAYRLTLPHPVTGESLTATAPLPAAFPFSLFTDQE